MGYIERREGGTTPADSKIPRTYKKGVCVFMKETREWKVHWGTEFEFRS